MVNTMHYNGHGLRSANDANVQGEIILPLFHFGDYMSIQLTSDTTETNLSSI